MITTTMMITAIATPEMAVVLLYLGTLIGFIACLVLVEFNNLRNPEPRRNVH